MLSQLQNRLQSRGANPSIETIFLATLRRYRSVRTLHMTQSDPTARMSSEERVPFFATCRADTQAFQASCARGSPIFHGARDFGEGQECALVGDREN